MKRTHLIFLPIFLVAFALLSGCHNKTDQQAPVAAPEVTYLTAAENEVAEFSELPGRLNAIRVAQIRARVPGILIHQERGGMNVKQGQLLFRIDPAPLQATLDSAEANLQKSIAVLSQAQAKADRYQSLVSYNAVSKQDYIDATAAAQSAAADVAANRAAVKTAQLNLGYATVTSPITGYMGRPSVTEGDLVGQGDATLLATVQQLDPIYLDLTQSSNEILRIRRAMEQGRLQRSGKDALRVTLVLDDGSQYPLPGKLLFSDISVDTATSMVTVRAEFPNPHQVLLPGMYARALVEQAAPRKAILLPQRVVTRGDQGSASVMVINTEDKVEARIVKLGEAHGNQWVILDGLQAGEKVIVEGLQKIAPGVSVKASPYQPAAAQSPTAVTH